MGLLIPLLTASGTAMMLDAMTGVAPLVFTKICIGDGTTETPYSATALEHQILEAEITDATITDQYIRLEGHYTNSGLTDGFYVKEIGVYASDGEELKLYAYSCSGDLTDYIPSIDSGRSVEENITLIVMVGSSDNVSAIISQESGYASEAALNAHIRDMNNPHHVTKDQIGLGNVPNLGPSDLPVDFNDEMTTLEDITSGSPLKELFARIEGGIKNLRSHIKNKQNPHNVTITQIHAAAEAHRHSAEDITSGTLPLERGGTGVTTAKALKTLVNREVTYLDDTLSAAKWTGNSYNLKMPGYNLEIGLDPAATVEQQAAFSVAMLAGSASSNVIMALGVVPVIDIPIIIRREEI